jgi:hypothetical protein
MRAQRYLPRKVLEIKNTDKKISLMGKIVHSEESMLLVEDETGQVEIFSEQPAQSGSFVRVFCSVIDGRLKADAVQSLNGFDVNLYNKTNELYRKFGL